MRRPGATFRAVLGACVLLALGACADEPELRRQVMVFGTLANLTLRGPTADALGPAADAVERGLAAHDRDWHPWRESDLTRLNAALARGEAYRPLPSVLDLVARARPLVAESEGSFDPAAGALFRAWGFHTGEWPSRVAVDRGVVDAWPRRRPRFENLRVEAGTLRSPDVLLQLDFNAIAEGVAGAQAMATLRARGVGSALLDLGGDVVALGDNAGRPWRVALRDAGGGVLGWVELGDGEALFASGSYAKFREDAGVRRAHVVDPRSGQPVDGSRASAVLLDDPVRADAGATALLVSGAGEFARRVSGMRLRCALLLTDDDVLHVTAGMERRLVLLREPARTQRHPGPASCRADD
jgi:thiamine biosynthesis lipoprotein